LPALLHELQLHRAADVRFVRVPQELLLMPVVVAGLVLVGLLGLVNLLFAVGVVRRLREHTKILDRLGDGSGQLILGPGETVGEFAATTVDGEPASVGTGDGPTLVGFFALGCQPCATKLPSFVEYAGEHPGGRDRVLAVVLGPEEEAAASYVTDLSGVARVVRGVEGDPLPTAFSVRGYPAFALVGTGGVVLASGTELTELSAAAVRA
jgi:thiol-disulfide isomerase/thioredoxin